MSLKEVDRLRVLEAVRAREISQKEGASRIGIKKRQMIRVMQDFRKYGPVSVISKKRGQESNRKICNTVRNAVVAIIKEQYRDFGPTLAQEELISHGYTIGVETLRQWMIGAGIWYPKQRRRIKPHQIRVRRPQRGEMIQIDGSPHDWFEGRGPKCCLLVAIDDATGEVMAARFVEAECTEGYFDLIEDYLSRHGRPLALYSDKHGIFRINAKEAESGTGETQFARAMRELGIDIICANTPQAKGRVERMNETLQDRLVKKMRLLRINDKDKANTFLPEFLKVLKEKFAVAPASPVDVHRAELPSPESLEMILSIQSTRKLSKSLELQYNNVTYQIQVNNPSYAMRGASITVCERKGKVILLYKGKELVYNTIDKQNQPQTILSSKDIERYFDRRSLGNKPKSSHPWKQSYPESRESVKIEHLPTVLPRQSDSSLPSALAVYG